MMDFYLQQIDTERIGIREEEANLMGKKEENTSVNVNQIACTLKAILGSKEMCPFCACLFILYFTGNRTSLALLFKVTNLENLFLPPPPKKSITITG